MKTKEELQDEILKIEGLAKNTVNAEKIANLQDEILTLDANLQDEILTLDADVKTITINGTTCKVLTLKELNDSDTSIVINSMADNDILTFPIEPIAVEVPFKLKGESLTYVGIKCVKLDELSGKEKEFILSFGNFNPLVCDVPNPTPEMLNYVKINEPFAGMRREEILTVVAGKKFLVKTDSVNFHSIANWDDTTEVKENGKFKKVPRMAFVEGKNVILTSPKKVYKITKM